MAKLEALMGKVVTDMGAIISAPLMAIGERLGLYKAMAGAGALSSQEVADRAGVAERPVREWLRNQAAGGYVSYDAETDRYTMPDEHATAFGGRGQSRLRPGRLRLDRRALRKGAGDRGLWHRASAATSARELRVSETSKRQHTRRARLWQRGLRLCWAGRPLAASGRHGVRLAARPFGFGSGPLRAAPRLQRPHEQPARM